MIRLLWDSYQGIFCNGKWSIENYHDQKKTTCDKYFIINNIIIDAYTGFFINTVIWDVFNSPFFSKLTLKLFQKISLPAYGVIPNK